MSGAHSRRQSHALHLIRSCINPIFQNSVFLVDHQCQQCGLTSLFLPEIPTPHSSVSSFHSETSGLHRWVADLSDRYSLGFYQ